MQAVGLLLGLVGLVMLIISPAAGVALLAIGGLCVISGWGAQRREAEEDRLDEEARWHKELMAATASKSQALDDPFAPIATADPFDEAHFSARVILSGRPSIQKRVPC